MWDLIGSLADLLPSRQLDRRPRDMERVTSALQLGLAALVLAIVVVVAWAYLA